jgi:hypothetical protein
LNPEEQRREFFDALFAFCNGGAINFRPVFRNKTDAISKFIPLNGDRIGKIESLCKKYDTPEFQGIYYGVATRNGGGKKDDIREVATLYADCDFKSVPKEILEAKLNEFPFLPSARIDTGGGFHPYWFLKEPATHDEYPQIEDALRRIGRYFGIPLHAVDASRVLRTPGTLNRKKEYDSPRSVNLVFCYPERRYNYKDILGILPEAPAPHIPVNSKDHSEDIERIMKCSFMRHCDKDRPSLPETHWYAMITQLAGRQGGRAKIHELSKGYPSYSPQETDAKILHALDGPGPHTCQYIRAQIWDCGKNCEVKSPAALTFKKSEIVTEDEIEVAKVNRQLVGFEDRIKTHFKGLDPGFDFLRKTIRAIVPTHVWSVGGYTSHGKSQFVIELLMRLLGSTKPKVTIFSAEMAAETYLLRMIASYTGIHTNELADNPALLERIGPEAYDFLRPHDLYLFDKINNLKKIRHICKRINSTWGLDVVVIDYLQNLRGTGSIYDRMSLLTPQLQQLAKELEITIIGLSQISNEALKDESGLIGLKGAGEIAAVSDLVIWLERDKEYDYLVHVQIRKNRHGPRGRTRLRWDKNFTRLEEVNGRTD